MHRSFALSACLVPTLLAVAEEAPVIVIEGERLVGEELALPLPGSISDLGTALRDQAGVDGVRMGGHGIDPVMRGMAQERISVTVDGANFHGGCPNRMDPPTSYISAELVDRIELALGVDSLLGAAPAPGGSVRAVRGELPRDGGEGEASLRAVSNGAGFGLAARGGYGSEEIGFEARGSYDDADDYDDGHGDEVHSAYTSWSAGAGVGGRSAAISWRADLDWSAGRDVSYAGARMDAPETDLILGQGQLRYEAADDGVLEALELRLSYGAVEHVMDNFSLRDVPVMMGTPRYMRADSTADTLTAELGAELRLFGREARIGLSWLTIDKWAERYAGTTSAVPMLQSVLWPDVEQQRLGLSYEQDLLADDARRLVLGLRLDHIDREAGSADKATAGGGSADSLYTMYYGHDSDAADDSIELGVLIRWQEDLSEALSYHIGFSRLVRPADATESFIAAANTTASMRWVGDPGIDDEVHHQLDAGLQLQGEGWQLGAAVFYDLVDDWILRDLASGQSGILLADGATIYRNVEARLYGGELRASMTIQTDWELAADLGYVHGSNADDDRALAQLPPLGGSLRASWAFRQGWRAELAMPWAADQTRIDLASGQDIGETAAWAVVDISCSARFAERWTASVGIDNLLDKHYAVHLNKASAFDPSVERVYEPGRAFWARVAATF